MRNRLIVPVRLCVPGVKLPSMPKKKRKVVRTSKNTLAKKSKKKASPAKRAGKARTTKARSTKKTAKKAAPKKELKGKARKKSSRANPVRELTQDIQNRRLTANQRNLAQESGDLEGLSRRPLADSESVDELAEEGNAFEAGAVAGVEEADNADEKEVHTREVPEDDVPEEYLDEQ